MMMPRVPPSLFLINTRIPSHFFKFPPRPKVLSLSSSFISLSVIAFVQRVLRRLVLPCRRLRGHRGSKRGTQLRWHRLRQGVQTEVVSGISSRLITRR
ncbi:hypothetical protein Bca4012_044742 [Brassica carinata]